LFERIDFLANIRESVAGNLADGATTATLLKPHELTNLIEGETQALRPLDEPNPVNHGGRISPHAGAALWDSQQMPALVVPYSFYPNFCRTREPPNGNGGIVATRRDSI
jgi:hypothetical protein